LVASVFMLLGLAYGRYVKRLVSENAPGDLSGEENIEFRSVDAEHVEGTVVNEMPDMLVQESGAVIDGTEPQADNLTGFEMPELDEPAPLPPPPTPAPLGGFEPPAPIGPPIEAQASFVDDGDLPPPTVPSGV